MRPLVIIEPDGATSEELRVALEAAGMRAECLTEGGRAIERVIRRQYSLAILDLDLLDTDPFAVCTEASRFVPVITLTGRADEEVCLKAFESGAGDHLVKPFAGRELIARIRSLLRRASPQDGESATSSAIAISISEMRVRAGDDTHDLTRGEAEVLSVLLENAPAPLTVSAIAAMLGAKRGTIESRIKTLRRKLGPQRLVSRGRLGYQIDGT
jgi:DNA-binding response OmpR family regulator